jgi:hypothetical protein
MVVLAFSLGLARLVSTLTDPCSGASDCQQLVDLRGPAVVVALLIGVPVAWKAARWAFRLPAGRR